MSQLVCDNDLFDTFIETGLLQELADWWKANGLEPHWVNDPVIISTDHAGRRTIHYTTPTGCDELAVTPETARRSSPLVVEPPAHWPRR